MTTPTPALRLRQTQSTNAPSEGRTSISSATDQPPSSDARIAVEAGAGPWILSEHDGRESKDRPPMSPQDHIVDKPDRRPDPQGKGLPTGEALSRLTTSATALLRVLAGSRLRQRIPQRCDRRDASKVVMRWATRLLPTGADGYRLRTSMSAGVARRRAFSIRASPTAGSLTTLSSAGRAALAAARKMCPTWVACASGCRYAAAAASPAARAAYRAASVATSLAARCASRAVTRCNFVRAAPLAKVQAALMAARGRGSLGRTTSKRGRTS